jgi:2,4-dienoyl-CoA reductase-like NADH-dependent reductase (Old Yellow Enzyme family)
VSRKTNHREDSYGGSFENRIRFPVEIVRAVRAAVGPDFPVIYRFSQWTVSDYTDIKFSNPEEIRIWATAMRDAGK